MRYREFHFPGPLAAHIECVWTMQPVGSAEFVVKRVFPDNCMDVYLTSDGPAMVAGPMTISYELEIPPGRAVFGLRLRPGAGSSLLGLPAHALRDQHVPLIEISRDVARRLSTKTTCAMSIRERHARVAETFARLEERGTPPDRIVLEAMRLITRTPSEAGLKTTRLALAVGERQLRRRFLNAVGYGPKRFMRIVRLQRLLDLIRLNRMERNWAQIALDAGYADQSHMINDVRSIAGVSPGNLGL
jgi:AraC-like DNA-binding protein